MLKVSPTKSRKAMEARYESRRGKYRAVIVDNKPSIELIDGTIVHSLETIKDLLDLFVAVASVLNQIYDDDKFPTQ